MGALTTSGDGALPTHGQMRAMKQIPQPYYADGIDALDLRISACDALRAVEYAEQMPYKRERKMEEEAVALICPRRFLLYLGFSGGPDANDRDHPAEITSHPNICRSHVRDPPER